jgi:hypothetical protein
MVEAITRRLKEWIRRNPAEAKRVVVNGDTLLNCHPELAGILRELDAAVLAESR